MAGAKGCACLCFVSALLDLSDYSVIRLSGLLFPFDTVDAIQASVEGDCLSLRLRFHISLEQSQIDQLLFCVPGGAIDELGSGLLIKRPVPLL